MSESSPTQCLAQFGPWCWGPASALSLESQLVLSERSSCHNQCRGVCVKSTQRLALYHATLHYQQSSPKKGSARFLQRGNGRVCNTLGDFKMQGSALVGLSVSRVDAHRCRASPPPVPAAVSTSHPQRIREGGHQREGASVRPQVLGELPLYRQVLVCLSHFKHYSPQELFVYLFLILILAALYFYCDTYVSPGFSHVCIVFLYSNLSSTWYHSLYGVGRCLEGSVFCYFSVDDMNNLLWCERLMNGQMP